MPDELYTLVDGNGRKVKLSLPEGISPQDLDEEDINKAFISAHGAMPSNKGTKGTPPLLRAPGSTPSGMNKVGLAETLLGRKLNSAELVSIQNITGDDATVKSEILKRVQGAKRLLPAVNDTGSIRNAPPKGLARTITDFRDSLLGTPVPNTGLIPQTRGGAIRTGFTPTADFIASGAGLPGAAKVGKAMAQDLRGDKAGAIATMRDVQANDSGAASAGARSAAKALPGATVGMGAFAATAAAVSPIAPLAGPLAPLVPLVAGGLAAAGLGKPVEAAVKQVKQKIFSPEFNAELDALEGLDQELHPDAVKMGMHAANLLFGKPTNPKLLSSKAWVAQGLTEQAAKAAARGYARQLATNTVALTATNTGFQAATGGPVTLESVGEDALMNLVMSGDPTRLGRGLTDISSRPIRDPLIRMGKLAPESNREIMGANRRKETQLRNTKIFPRAGDASKPLGDIKVGGRVLAVTNKSDLEEKPLAQVPIRLPKRASSQEKSAAYAEVMRLAKAAGDPHPEVTAAQWAYESGWGSSQSGDNNLFGVKTGDNWKGPSKTVTTREKNGTQVIRAAFRSYESPEASILDHLSVKQKDRYANYWKAKTPEEAAQALQDGGYADDTDYAANISRLMRQMRGRMPKRVDTGLPKKFAEKVTTAKAKNAVQETSAQRLKAEQDKRMADIAAQYDGEGKLMPPLAIEPVRGAQKPETAIPEAVAKPAPVPAADPVTAGSKTVIPKAELDAIASPLPVAEGVSAPEAPSPYDMTLKRTGTRVGRRRGAVGGKARKNAPMVAPDNSGTETEGVTYTSRNEPVPFRYEVVPRSSLIVSHDLNLNENPLYREGPEGLQPRQRTNSVTSRTKIQNDSFNLNPELLGANPLASDGAPIVGPDGRIEGGNGRALLLDTVRTQQGDKEKGATYAARAKAYDEFVKKFAAARGLSTDGVDQPVLIRRRTDNRTPAQRVILAQHLNEETMLRQDTLEQAMQDGSRIADSLDVYNPDHGLGPRNAGIIAAFFSAKDAEGNTVSLNKNEFSTVADQKSGTIDAAGAERIRNAMLSTVFTKPERFRDFMTGKYENARNIANAMKETGPVLAHLKAVSKKPGGRADLDITPDLETALRAISDIRKSASSGKSIKEAVTDWKGAQETVDMFGEGDPTSGKVSSETAELIGTLMGPDYTRSAGRTQDFLEHYNRLWREESARPKPTKTKADLIKEADRLARNVAGGEQLDLLGAMAEANKPTPKPDNTNTPVEAPVKPVEKPVAPKVETPAPKPETPVETPITEVSKEGFAAQVERSRQSDEAAKPVRDLRARIATDTKNGSVELAIPGKTDTQGIDIPGKMNGEVTTKSAGSAVRKVEDAREALESFMDRLKDYVAESTGKNRLLKKELDELIDSTDEELSSKIEGADSHIDSKPVRSDYERGEDGTQEYRDDLENWVDEYNAAYGSEITEFPKTLRDFAYDIESRVNNNAPENPLPKPPVTAGSKPDPLAPETGVSLNNLEMPGNMDLPPIEDVLKAGDKAAELLRKRKKEELMKKLKADAEKRDC